MKHRIICILFLMLYSSFANAQKADLILYNGKIFTSDPAKLYVEAIAIRDEKVLAVGKTSAIRRLADAKTKQVDLQGKTVVPGFNDAHDHPCWLVPIGQSYFTPFSIPGPTKAEVIDSLSRLAERAKPREWIQGTIGLTVFNDTSVRRRLLDSIAPANPVALQIMWGHGMILNTRALREIHITDTAADPLSGWYERRPGSRNITGALFEGSEFPAWQALTDSDPAAAIASLKQKAAEQLSLGITTVQYMSASLNGNSARRFFNEAAPPLRTRVVAMPGSTERGRSLGDWPTRDTRLNNTTVISGIKYVMDGTRLEQTALIITPYPGRPDWYGRLNFPTDTIKQILREALTGKRQLLMHIVGDSATKRILELMKGMTSNSEWKKKRVRIEHGSGILTEAMEKDVIDMGIVVIHTPQYGMGAPLRSRLVKGMKLAIGPDAVINPFLAIMTVTARQTDTTENLTREQAVIAYTTGAAYAEFMETKKGRLAKGMLADLAVLSQDIFTVPFQALPATRSVMTIVGGRVWYEQKQEQ